MSQICNTKGHLPHLCAETADKCSKSHWMYFTYIVCAYASMENNWNNKLFVAEGIICQICLNVKCMCGPICNCYLNGFDSKETSVFYCFFQSHTNPRELILLFGTAIIL